MLQGGDGGSSASTTRNDAAAVAPKPQPALTQAEQPPETKTAPKTDSALGRNLLARCQNAHLGPFEGPWSSEPTSVVHLVESNDILEKMTCAFTKPTKSTRRHRRGMAWGYHVRGHHIWRSHHRHTAEAFLPR